MGRIQWGTAERAPAARRQRRNLAFLIPSKKSPLSLLLFSLFLFVPERLDRVEPRGLESGIEAEDDPDECREKECECDGAGLDGHGPAGEPRDGALDAETDRDSRRAAGEGERE